MIFFFNEKCKTLQYFEEQHLFICMEKILFSLLFFIPLVIDKRGKLKYLLAEGREIRIIFPHMYIKWKMLYLKPLKQTTKAKILQNH